MLIVLPIWGWQREKKLSRTAKTEEKISIYFQLSLILALVSLLIILVKGWQQTVHFNIKVVSNDHWTWSSFSGYILIFVLCLFIVVNLLPFFMMRMETFRTAVKEAFDHRSHVYPTTKKERLAYVAAAVFVGIGEEVMYRSFLAAYISIHWLPHSLVMSVLITNVLFAAAHYHQGISGIINALAAGISFSAMFMLTGTLIIPTIAHIAYDLKIFGISKFHDAVTPKART